MARNIEFIVAGKTLLAYDKDHDNLYALDGAAGKWLQLPDIPVPAISEIEWPKPEVPEPEVPEPPDKPAESTAPTPRVRRKGYTDEFQTFWGQYRALCVQNPTPDGNAPSPGAKHTAYKFWGKLSKADQTAAVANLAQWFKQTDYPVHGERYLKHRRWEDVDDVTEPKPPKSDVHLCRKYIEKHGFDTVANNLGFADALGPDDLIGMMLQDESAMEKVLACD